jgi:hypothetical protein
MCAGYEDRPASLAKRQRRLTGGTTALPLILAVLVVVVIVGGVPVTVVDVVRVVAVRHGLVAAGRPVLVLMLGVAPVRPVPVLLLLGSHDRLPSDR